jgi:hypothetical protein
LITGEESKEGRQVKEDVLKNTRACLTNIMKEANASQYKNKNNNKAQLEKALCGPLYPLIHTGHTTHDVYYYRGLPW